MRGVTTLTLCMLVAPPALGQQRGPYTSASFGGRAGSGLESMSVSAVGLNVTTGFRASRWISFEGFFEAWFSQTWREPAEGAMCSGNYAHQWHWETFGLRLWTHLTDNEHIDFAIAPPWIALGPTFDHGRSVVGAPGSICYVGPYDTSDMMFVVGLVGLALELRAGRYAALRLSANVELDIGESAGPNVLSLGGFVGPVIHF